MKFYAYIPDKNGNEPMGTGNKTLFELKTIRGAIRRAYKVLKIPVYERMIVMFSYTNFYNNDTYKRII